MGPILCVRVKVRAGLPAGGNRIRTIGPASGKVVGSNPEFARQVLSLPWRAETSNSRSRRETTVLRPIDLCANRSDRRQSREGDRWFESTSLQRGVTCEPRREHSGAGARAPSGRTYVSAVQAANALARRVLI